MDSELPQKLQRCHSAQARPPGLLDLPEGLQEAILWHLYQEELQLRVPLVCRQLDALQKGSRVLWESCWLNLESAPNAERVSAMLAWVTRRKAAIQDLALHIEPTGWLAPAAQALLLLQPSLRELELSVWEHGAQPALSGSAADITRLMQPIQGAVQLRRLSVECILEGDGQPAGPNLQQLTQLESLSWEAQGQVPAGLAGLHRSLTFLDASLTPHTTHSWLNAIAHLTKLKELMVFGPEELNWEEHLTVLSRLSQLDSLSVTEGWLTALPPLAMPQLTYLSLYSNCFEAEGCLAHLPQLRNLKALDLGQCCMNHLPPQVTALSQLETLSFKWNRSLSLGSVDVRNVLARLTRLTKLDLTDVEAISAGADAWAALRQTCPGIHILAHGL